LTSLDNKDGFIILFDASSISGSQLTGRIPKGKWKGHRVILKVPRK
jgi:hypothetical protein